MRTTGERFVPDSYMGSEIEIEHLHRYHAIAPAMKGKTVLDGACGTGYGSKILAQYARQVVGIDIAPEAVSYADKFFSAENLAYKVMSIEELNFPQHYFDAVVSFETLEHVDQALQHSFLAQVKKVLQPEGALVISTPDYDVLQKLENGKYYNPYHIKEYNAKEFEALLGQYFEYVKIYRQNNVTCSVIDGASSEMKQDVHTFPEGKYLIAICSDVEQSIGLGGVFVPSDIRKELKSFFYIGDREKRFSEEGMICATQPISEGDRFSSRISLSGIEFGALRFDPCDYACIVSEIKAYTNVGPVKIEQLNANIVDSTGHYFMHSDPVYLIGDICDDVEYIEVTGVLRQIPNVDVELYWMNKCAQAEAGETALLGELSNERIAAVRLQEENAVKEQEYVQQLNAKEQEYVQQLNAKEQEYVQQLNAKEQEYVQQLNAKEQEHVQQLNAKEQEYVQQLNAKEQEHVQQLNAKEQEYVQQLNAKEQEYVQYRTQIECECAEYAQQYSQEQAQVERLTNQVMQLQEAYTVVSAQYECISNSTTWRMTKPVRVLLDCLKHYLYRIKELARLSKKAIRVLKNDGFTAMQLKITQYLDKKRGNEQQEVPALAGMSTTMCFRDGSVEPDIPMGWIAIQPVQPLISVVVAVKEVDRRADCLRRALESLLCQKYQNFQVLLVYSGRDAQITSRQIKPYQKKLNIKLVDVPDTANRQDYWDAALEQADGSWIAFLEQEDELTPNALAYVLDGVNENPDVKLFVLPDDRLTEDGEYILPDYKVGIEWGLGGIDTLLHVGVLQKNGCSFADGSMGKWLGELKKEQIQVIPWIACHGQMIESVWQDEEKIRCLAFYLPQFHEIPENNEWWGKGFTEWVNVKKAEALYPGHHQPRHPGELGYYDLGDETGTKVQKKQIALAKEYGLGGFCYYYYWFDEGRRLLEKPLDRHLNDKSMDFPFCLCWANENWSRRWDGLDSEILMPQTYGEGWAEQFILDTLPYLQDERYIRVNGAPYLLIYNVADIKNAGEAINTWRRIAAEHGIERLHISAVRRTINAQEFEQSGYTLDSLTDFPPHLLGMVGVDHDEPERFNLPAGQVKDYHKAAQYHINTGKQPYAYFRTSMLEWDNTARKGRNAYIFENFSLTDYIKWLYSGKRYTLRQNKAGEDLVFINAWNEWAEGTYLEPSEPNGHSALEATRKALKMR